MERCKGRCRHESRAGFPKPAGDEKDPQQITTNMFPILIVDDLREDSELAERVFRDANIVNPIFRMNRGEACVDFLRQRYSPGAKDKMPAALVLMDLQMPVMNGVQTIAAINEAVLNPGPFIVMISGQADVKLVREGYQLGAKTFLTKPLTGRDLDGFLESNERLISTVMRASGYELHWIGR